jgi:hypothetical protein
MEKIPVSGLISPIFSTDDYPVIDPRFGIDGLRCLDSTTEMYNLPLEKRRGGMVVGIPNTSNNTVAYYKLKPEGNGLTWEVGATGNWDGFFTSVTNSVAVPIKNNISNETITNPTNYQYLIWGTMSIGQSGSFVNDGDAYFVNGGISLTSDGTYSGTGDYIYVRVPTKYSVSTTIQPTGTTISHNLNTQDITYSTRSTTNFVTTNVEIIDDNNIKVTSLTASTLTVTVIG